MDLIEGVEGEAYTVKLQYIPTERGRLGHRHRPTVPHNFTIIPPAIAWPCRMADGRGDGEAVNRGCEGVSVRIHRGVRAVTAICRASGLVFGRIYTGRIINLRCVNAPV